MSLQAQQLRDEIREVIAEVGEIDNIESITPELHLMRDLELDSMMLLELLSTLERRYKVSIPEDEFPNMVTLETCVATLQRLLLLSSSSS